MLYVSGADLSALVREAGLCVMRKLTRKYSSVSSTTTQQQSLSLPHPQSSVMVWEDSQLCITPEEFDEAFSRVKPSVSAQERRAYERIAGKLSRNHIGEKYENVPQIV
jgi:SpoVK/Ycf46/Vps4 family AAA+-type ATPase